MIGDDEYLERIVAAIQSVTTEGAQVAWNEVVNGRQFDVVIRFQFGTLRYLVVVEVKNRSRKAEVSDIDAFVTKARDQKANKAVFVTAAGFQVGAKEVAERHAVDLFTVTFDDRIPVAPEHAAMIGVRRKGAPNAEPPNISWGEPQLIANVERITLVYAAGTEAELPSDPSQMTYYCGKTKLQDGRSLSQLVETAPRADIELNKSRDELIHLDPPQRIEPPDTHFFPRGDVTGIKTTVTGRLGRPIRGNVRIDPGLFTYPVVYTNVVTGEAVRFNHGQLPLGGGHVSPGNFYFSYHPLNYFYCQRIQGDRVTWHLVESFQNGEKVTGTFTQRTQYSKYYIPVSDKKTLKRLKARLEEYRQRNASIT